jgi:quercetin dioxygenase-like cupin family protein
MYVTHNAVLPRSSLPGIEHSTLAGSDKGLKALSVWRQAIAPGAATPPHRHDCEEVVVVTRGRGELRIGDAVHAFGPDTTLVIPPGVAHQVLNAGDEPLELLAAFSTSPVPVTLPDGTPLPLPWSS